MNAMKLIRNNQLKCNILGVLQIVEYSVYMYVTHIMVTLHILWSLLGMRIMIMGPPHQK